MILPSDKERLSMGPKSDHPIKKPRFEKRMERSLNTGAPIDPKTIVAASQENLLSAPIQQPEQDKPVPDAVKNLDSRIKHTTEQLQELNSLLSQLKAAGLMIEDVEAVAMDAEENPTDMPMPDTPFQENLIRDIQKISKSQFCDQ